MKIRYLTIRVVQRHFVVRRSLNACANCEARGRHRVFESDICRRLLLVHGASVRYPGWCNFDYLGLHGRSESEPDL
jgi:hypothetical protein